MLERKIDRLRHRGIGGTRIQPHRSIYQLKLNPADLVIALLLPLIFNILLLLCLDNLVELWRAILTFWLERVAPGTGVMDTRIDIGPYTLWLPIAALSAQAPDAGLWWSTFAGCILLLIGTCFIPPKRFLPLVYIVRACVLIQATALAYFFFIPASFPYELKDYLTDATGMALMLMFIGPWILGATYAIFDFPLLQKLALIGLLLVYLSIALPMQYLLHALLLHHVSLLFLPICYLVFGVFLDVMMFVALYSWGMSWRFKAFRAEAG